jgi:clan AA aspartic protease (TIGR02281 family)
MAFFFAAGLIVRADGPATRPLEDVLKSDNLSKVGLLIVLGDETAIHDQVRAARALKYKLSAEAANRAMMAQNIANAQAQWDRMDAQFKDLAVRIDNTNNDSQKNRLIVAKNALVNPSNSLAKQIQDAKDQQEKLPDSRADFIAAVQDLSDKIPPVQDAYKSLADDSELKDAIATYNAGHTGKVRLGPSPAFLADADFVKQNAAAVKTGVVPITIDGGVPTLPGIINGKTHVTFVWDSGAAFVTLSASTASDLDLNPGKDAKTVQLVTADGKIVKAKIMPLDSIRIGEFVAHDIEAAIMPDNVKSSDNLLGQTFQRHFMARIDLGNGQLHLTPLDKESATTDGKPSAGPGPAQ